MGTRHDQSPKAMILGLYDMAWRHEAYCLGLTDKIVASGIDQRKLTDRERSAFQLTHSMPKLTRKNTRAMMIMMRQIIKDFGWSAEARSPLKESAIPDPVLARMVGFSGEGACEDCLAKPPTRPQIKSSFDAMLPAVLNNMWHNYVLSEAYREHQVKVLNQTDFFGGDEAAYRTEAVYKSSGGVIQAAFLCIAKGMENFALVRLDKKNPRPKIDIEVPKNRRLEIVDKQYDRKWCAACKKSVVKFDLDIFDLI